MFTTAWTPVSGGSALTSAVITDWCSPSATSRCSKAALSRSSAILSMRPTTSNGGRLVFATAIRNNNCWISGRSSTKALSGVIRCHRTCLRTCSRLPPRSRGERFCTTENSIAVVRSPCHVRSPTVGRRRVRSDMRSPRWPRFLSDCRSRVRLMSPRTIAFVRTVSSARRFARRRPAQPAPSHRLRRYPYRVDRTRGPTVRVIRCPERRPMSPPLLRRVIANSLNWFQPI